MYLIDACPVPTPADAERLLADLWQLTSGRSLGLYLFGLGDRLMLGVTCPHRRVEETAAATIADQCGGESERGSMIPALVSSAPTVAAMNLLPTDRHLAVESRTFGWQRTDPLRGTFLTLLNTPRDAIAAVALSLRALPDLAFAVSIGVFAAGPSADVHGARLAASFGGIGVRFRRPLLQQRAVRRMLRGGLRRPASVHRVEIVALFWHPPYSTDLGTAGPDPVHAAPTGGAAPGQVP